MRKAKKNPADVALGRLGGKKGGPARARALTAEERRRISSEAGKLSASNMTAAEKLARGRKLTAARLAKRAAEETLTPPPSRATNRRKS